MWLLRILEILGEFRYVGTRPEILGEFRYVGTRPEILGEFRYGAVLKLLRSYPTMSSLTRLLHVVRRSCGSLPARCTGRDHTR